MPRLFLRLDWVLAAFFAVMNVSSVGPASPADPADAACTGGILYGTVWQTASGGWGGSGVVVYALRTDGRAILGSDRTDARGRYRICGLPLRTRMDLVAVPPDASAGVHVETITLTLAGGQQRNVYPTGKLQRLPGLILRQGVAPRTSSLDRVPASAARPGESVVASQIRRLSEAEAEARMQADLARTLPAAEAARIAASIPYPEPRDVAPVLGVPAQQVADDAYYDDLPDHVRQGSLRVVSGDGLLMYFSGDEPRYMQLRIPGLDGRGCYFEFDWGIDEQDLVPAADGYDLVSPAWGRIGVRRAGEETVLLDLANVYAPVCRVRSAGGNPLTWRRGIAGWSRVAQ